MFNLWYCNFFPQLPGTTKDNDLRSLNSLQWAEFLFYPEFLIAKAHTPSRTLLAVQSCKHGKDSKPAIIVHVVGGLFPHILWIISCFRAKCK